MNDNIQEYVREALIRSTNDLNQFSSDSDIQGYLSQYDSNQAEGVLNNIKGIAHELYYQDIENTDGDSIFADIHEAVNHPGSDVILTDFETGHEIEVQLKATASPDYVMDAMEKYPDTPIIATDEVAFELGLDSSGISNQTLTTEVGDALSDYGLDGLERGTGEYVAMTYAAEQGVSETDALNDFWDGLGDVGNAALTGGFYAMLQFFKDNPSKQKKVVDVALAAGIADGFIDFGAGGLESGFDLNPLFVASLASWISIRGIQSSNQKISNISSSFAYTTTKALEVVEYGSYAAIGFELVDLISGVDVIESVAGALEAVDVFNIFDGADFIDGLTSFGIGLLASRGVKALMDKFNEADRQKIIDLQKAVATRELFRSMLKSDLPVPLLAGPYTELR